MITLYVDHISEDGKTGITTNPDNIRYNNNLILNTQEFTDKIISDNTATTIGISNTYVFVVLVSLETAKYQMVLFEPEATETIHLIQKHLSPYYQDSLSHLLSHVRDNYEQYSGRTILVVGDAPHEPQ